MEDENKIHNIHDQLKYMMESITINQIPKY